MNLQEKVTSLCKAKKITLGELAQKLGITYQALNKSLRNNPQLKRLQEIADVLNLPVDMLLEDGEREIIGFISIDREVTVIKNEDDLHKFIETFNAD